MKIKIEKEDIKVLDKIREFKSVNNNDVVMLERFMNKYVKPGINICRHCPAQIRHAWNLTINWANKNSEAIEAVRFDGVCFNCQKELSDKRKKYCSKSCRREFKNL